MFVGLRLIAAVALVGLAVILAWGLVLGPAPIHQPLLYNHNVHVEEEGLECIDCHESVEQAAYATIPRLNLCLDCHDTEPMSESPEEAKLIAHIESEEEIAWNQVYRVPSHVYFSHRRHVTLGEVECSVCHGNVPEQMVPVQAPVIPLTMEWCMDCHTENKVSNDCLACHR